jgi:hypothetical protein
METEEEAVSTYYCMIALALRHQKMIEGQTGRTESQQIAYVLRNYHLTDSRGKVINPAFI